MSDYYLCLNNEHYIPLDTIVGIFSIMEPSIKSIYTTLLKKGKVLELTGSVRAKQPKTLIMLKNGLAVLSSIEPRELASQYCPDPYPPLLKTLLTELFEKLDTRKTD